jgi:hypothetical protein
MRNQSKLIAHVLDADILNTESQDTRSILGEHHFLNTSSGALLVCFPVDFDTATTFLTNLGAVVFPHLFDPSEVGEQIEGRVSHLAKVSKKDSAYTAAHKIHQEIKWPPINPRN